MQDPLKYKESKVSIVKLPVIKTPQPKLAKTKLALGKGETFSLKILNAPKGTIKYTSAKKAIIKTDRKGKLTAKKIGKTKITVTCSTGKKLTCTVTVKKAPQKITLKKKKITLKKGKTYQIKAALPKNTASRLSYKSSKKSVASVDANGKVTARKKGTAKIKVLTFNKKWVKMEVKVK